jgi:hypothetical protein
VVIVEEPLPDLYFEHLFKKAKYAFYSYRIKKDEDQLNITRDARWFEDIANCLFKAGLTWDDHEEACEMSVIESKVSPNLHEAIAELYKIPPFIGLGFNSTSWIESLRFLAQYKRLPVSMIEGSWLEFHNKKFTGRYFFNYDINKFKTGSRMLRRLNCLPDLVINKKKVEVLTLSDTIRPDGYFRKFVALGGMSLWVDKSVQERMQLHSRTPAILEMNIPEALNDMRIFTYPVKHLYRARIITTLSPPEELNTASSSVGKLIKFGQECLKLTDERLLNERCKEFIDRSNETLILLSKFDFPRYSTGIDFKHLDILPHRDVEKRKKAISDILEIYVQNFPEALADESWLKGLI